MNRLGLASSGPTRAGCHSWAASIRATRARSRSSLGAGITIWDPGDATRRTHTHRSAEQVRVGAAHDLIVRGHDTITVASCSAAIRPCGRGTSSSNRPTPEWTRPWTETRSDEPIGPILTPDGATIVLPGVVRPTRCSSMPHRPHPGGRRDNRHRQSRAVGRVARQPNARRGALVGRHRPHRHPDGQRPPGADEPARADRRVRLRGQPGGRVQPRRRVRRALPRCRPDSRSGAPGAATRSGSSAASTSRRCATGTDPNDVEDIITDFNDQLAVSFGANDRTLSVTRMTRFTHRGRCRGPSQRYQISRTKTWSMRRADWMRAACDIAGRDLSRQEWDDLVGKNVAYHQTCTPLLAAAKPR